MVLDIIRDRYNDILPPRPLLTGEEFFYRSTSQWAVKEIMRAIMSSYDDPFETISLFIEKMDQYATSAKTDKQKRLFSIAYDMSVWIEDMVTNAK
jgi:hypothetical protein